MGNASLVIDYLEFFNAQFRRKTPPLPYAGTVRLFSFGRPVGPAVSWAKALIHAGSGLSPRPQVGVRTEHIQAVDDVNDEGLRYAVLQTFA
jgi:hypothetical protein